jgi:hypothetical protein
MKPIPHRPDLARPRSLVVALLLAAVVAACGGGTDHAPGSDSATSLPAAQPTPSAGVAFEPAYPTEVSAEGLSPQDTAQQETPHRHEGGEEHTHGDEKEPEEPEGDHGHPH